MTKSEPKMVISAFDAGLFRSDPERIVRETKTAGPVKTVSVAQTLLSAGRDEALCSAAEPRCSAAHDLMHQRGGPIQLRKRLCDVRRSHCQRRGTVRQLRSLSRESRCVDRELRSARRGLRHSFRELRHWLCGVRRTRRAVRRNRFGSCDESLASEYSECSGIAPRYSAGCAEGASSLCP